MAYTLEEATERFGLPAEYIQASLASGRLSEMSYFELAKLKSYYIQMQSSEDETDEQVIAKLIAVYGEERVKEKLACGMDPYELIRMAKR
ncbi:hypothetical protein NF212_11465 [Parasalinivibrio latis]|uniref:hypothetical protein n=1 Tax=Parasalinivibrio latis TaxID=2952610 RepID=UPI0030E3F377